MALSRRTKVAAVATTAGVVGALMFGLAPAQAQPLADGLRTTAVVSTTPRVQLKVLVLDDGQAMVRSIVAQLDREGVPYQTVDLNAAKRTQITSTFLAGSDKKGQYANFQGVVAPVTSPTQLSATELAALRTFERSFGIRQVSAYNWPSATSGLQAPVYSGAIDGLPATVTTAAKNDGFSYLKGSFKFDDFDKNVTESYGYISNALATMPAGASYTPFIATTGPGGQKGSVLGVTNDNGFEDMVITFAENEYQQTNSTIGHGIVQWLTRGVHLGEYRNYLSVHIDDVFLADDLWSVDGKCTTGDGCDPAVYPEDTARMTAADVEFLRSWQKSSGVKLDMVFNGGGSDEYAAQNKLKSDPLLTQFKSTANKGSQKDFRWTSHTFTHENLSCVIDENSYPADCKLDAKGNYTPTPLATLRAQFSKNKSWASSKGLTIRKAEVVTGEHTGLKSLPKFTTDNPYLATAVDKEGITWLASDASREKDQRAIGKALTVPRYPMNIYYNVATKAQEVAEYNWIYTSRANGGSGLCEDNPATSTCIAPLSLASGYESTIVPAEARLMLRHMTTNDARPHYAHQSNLTQDRVLYPVVDSALAQYNAIYDATTTPIVNPTETDAGTALKDQAQWTAHSGSVTAMLEGTKVTITNPTGDKVYVPVTAGPKSTALKNAYANSRSGLVTVCKKCSASVTLKAADVTYTGYKAAGASVLENQVAAAAPLVAAPTKPVPVGEVPAAVQAEVAGVAGAK